MSPRVTSSQCRTPSVVRFAPVFELVFLDGHPEERGFIVQFQLTRQWLDGAITQSLNDSILLFSSSAFRTFSGVTGSEVIHTPTAS